MTRVIPFDFNQADQHFLERHPTDGRLLAFDPMQKFR